MTRPRPTFLALPWLLVAATLLPAASAAQDDAAPAPPPVTIESIAVDPASPGPDTLCKLTVTLKNAGDKTASQFGFRVSINGQDLPVYGNQLFMYPLPAGTTDALQLYTFWSTETSRPVPASGTFEIEVSLTESRWFEIADDEEGVEVWTPQGDVPGLPSSKSVTLPMAKPAAPAGG